LYFLSNITKELTGSICKYGTDCYNKSPSHLEKYFHNIDPDSISKLEKQETAEGKKRKNKRTTKKIIKNKSRIHKPKLKKVKTRSKPKNKKK